jgi:hypothetical protein
MFSIVKKLIPSSDGSAHRTKVSRWTVESGVDSIGSKEPPPSRTATSAPGSLIHRNLCSMILRDTLRMHGIPKEWIGIDVRVLSGSATTVQLQISLVIRHWHEGLFKFAPALQKQFLRSLQGFDPDTDYSRQVVFWRFSAKCQVPDIEIPGPQFWASTSSSDAPFQGAGTTRTPVSPPLNPDPKREQNGSFPPTGPQNL